MARSLASIKYENTVLKCAKDLAREGGFTAREMSEKCGVKLTQHLRARLRDFAKRGELQEVEAYTESGHLATYYILPIPPEVQSNQRLPF